MSETQTFRLVHPAARQHAINAVQLAPHGHVVVVREPKRSLDQNAKLHALVADIAKAKPEWNEIKMDEDDWKSLLIVSHAIATGGGIEAMRLVRDLEGNGLVQLRESSARMSKERSSSLIEYITAWAVSHGISLREPSQ